MLSFGRCFPVLASRPYEEAPRYETLLPRSIQIQSAFCMQCSERTLVTNLLLT